VNVNVPPVIDADIAVSDMYVSVPVVFPSTVQVGNNNRYAAVLSGNIVLRLL
jgi:hypothetical protein